MPLAFNTKSKYNQMCDVLHDTNVNNSIYRIIYICGLIINFFLFTFVYLTY